MKTKAVYVMNLCIPCENRCRYCLLSYNGKTSGVNYQRSEAYALQFYTWLKENRPELSFLFGFGYSMEHPHLLHAIDFCQSIGSASGEFLQFDGMKFRTDQELEDLLCQLKSHGIRLIDLTFYGTESYHDRFAARTGDYRLMMRTLAMANRVGLDVTVNIPVTQENAQQMDTLMTELHAYRTRRIACFIPHGEGRGRLLDAVRLSAEDFAGLSQDVQSCINRDRFKTEEEWLLGGFPVLQNRALAVTLTQENMDYFEKLPFDETIAYLERLDDNYYSVVPSVQKLAQLYGNPNGDRLYSARDLYLSYQRRYLSEQKVDIYDINDERQCFSRRY